MLRKRPIKQRLIRELHRIAGPPPPPGEMIKYEIARAEGSSLILVFLCLGLFWAGNQGIGAALWSKKKKLSHDTCA